MGGWCGRCGAAAEDGPSSSSASAPPPEGDGAGPSGSPSALATEGGARAGGQSSLRGLPVPLYILSVPPTLMEDREQAEATLRTCAAQGLANAVVLMDGPRTARQMRDHAVALKALCRSLDLKFLVDGRVGLAAAVGSDGIKLDFDVDLNTTRTYLDACCEAADWGDAGDVYEVWGRGTRGLRVRPGRASAPSGALSGGSLP